ncbi:MAG: ABC transporter permease, partial [Nitrospirota bacterium]|nr:ABC transporter permease [Nitrospirota bacterium]
RDKVLYTLLFFALIMIGGTSILSLLTLGERQKIIIDLGLASISIFGLFIAVFIGIGLVYKEIDRRTIYTIISKPIHRYQFLLGKYLGLVLTLFVEVVIMTIVFMAVTALYESPDPALLKAVLLTFQELMLITAIAILFSSFSTPVLSSLFTVAVFIIGHMSQDLKIFGAKTGSLVIQKVTNFLYYMLPNLSNFNIKGQVVYGVPVEWSYIGIVTAYTALYIAIVLSISAMIFQYRDFK